jgi:hypothetical protein
MIPYTYCFIRKDLPKHYQIIQACHATQEITKSAEHPDQVCHFILFEVKDECKLTEVKMTLDEKGIDSHMFREPDNGTGYTAICTGPIYGEDRNFFRKFKMFSV